MQAWGITVNKHGQLYTAANEQKYVRQTELTVSERTCGAAQQDCRAFRTEAEVCLPYLNMPLITTVQLVPMLRK
jgi:hypothetical protein